MIKKVLINAAIASLLIAPASFAGNHNSSMNYSQPENNLQEVFQQLDLSFAQKREMRKIKMNAQSAEREIADQIRGNFMKLQDYAAGNYDAKAIKKLAKKQGQLMAQQIEHNMKVRNQLFNVLTDEQKSKFKGLVGADS